MSKTIINRILHGDCLEESRHIESGSVDLILTDLPYGTVTNMAESKNVNHGMKNKTGWDIAIEPSNVYKIANRILRKNGKMVLFSQEPYTTRLITEAIPNVPFNYRMIWEKDHFANSLIAKKAPVSYYEDVLVFSKSECREARHPLRLVMNKYVEKLGRDRIINLFMEEGRYKNEVSARVHASYKFGFNNGMRFDLMDSGMYEFLSANIDFEESYEELKNVDKEYKQNYASTFNLWQGGKYKSNILRCKKDYSGYHPTQKPILLLEDLIKTFSNEGDIVVDLTAGSGSTAVAAINTNRNFICIEKDWDYCETANKRINDAIKTDSR